MVIAANADNVFRRLCEAMGRPELADDARFATHLARGENQDEIEGIVAEWAARARRDGDRRDPQRGRRHLRADLHDRRHLRGRAVPGPRDARRARGPGVRRVRRPRHRPEVLARRPARSAGRRPGRRAATTARSTAACSGSPTTSSRALKRGGRPVSGHRSATSARATGSRTTPKMLEPADPGRARQPPRGRRRAADRGGQLRQPGARAADGRRGGGRRGDRAARRRRLRRPRAQRAGLRPAARDRRSTRCTSRSPSSEDVQPAQRERLGRGVGRGRRADRRARARGRARVRP